MNHINLGKPRKEEQLGEKTASDISLVTGG